MVKIICFTDGSCYYKTKVGGWAYLAFLPSKEVYMNGGLKNTTVGRCELIAFIRLLEKFKHTKFYLEVYVDNQYIAFLFLKNWLRKWVKLGILEERKNHDLLKILWDLYVNYYQNRLSVIWVRGHTKTDDIKSNGNYIVDKLCNYKNKFAVIENDLGHV